jgi:hypothetical protein
VAFRVTAGRLLTYFGVFGLIAGMAGGALTNSTSFALGLTLSIWIVGPIGHYFNTKSQLVREDGLPWEEQHVVLDDDGFHSTYTSGFAVVVPWSKFTSYRSFPEGLYLVLEGRSSSFIPIEVLTPEVEAFVCSKVKHH